MRARHLSLQILYIFLHNIYAQDQSSRTNLQKYPSVLLLTSTNVLHKKKVYLKICPATGNTLQLALQVAVFGCTCVQPSTNHIECPSIPIKSHASRGLLFCRPNDRVLPEWAEYFISRPIHCIKEDAAFSREFFFNNKTLNICV